MTNEELVLLYQQGDNKALEELITNNDGMVHTIVNKFYVNNSNSIDKQDLEQEGFIGLIEAAEKYNLDMENSAKFVTYAFYYIYKRISKFYNTHNTDSEISIDTPTKINEDLKIIDTIEDIDHSFENVEEHIYLKQLRNDLEQAMNGNNTLFEREVLKLHYGWDNKSCTLNEIAEIFDTDISKIRNTESKALKKLRTSEWGIEAEKEYFINKAEEIQESSKFNQDNSVVVIDIIDKYLGGVQL